MKKVITYIGVVAVALVAVVVVWLHLSLDPSEFANQPTDESNALPPVEALAPKSAEIRDNGENSDGVNSTSASSARKVISARGRIENYSHREADLPKRISLVERVENTLESHDPSSAYPAFLALKQCRQVPIHDPTWDTAREDLQRLQNDPDTAPAMRLALDVKDVSFEQMHSECRALTELRSRSLESDLIHKGNEGDPFARFIYAMWPPNEDASVEMGDEGNLAYETTALAFTLENLEEGHPLGLLALGLSYTQGRYFTPFRRSLGIAMLVASDLCAGDAFQVEYYIDLYMQTRRHVVGHQPSNEQVLALGTELHERYCATSVAHSQE